MSGKQYDYNTGLLTELQTHRSSKLSQEIIINA